MRPQPVRLDPANLDTAPRCSGIISGCSHATGVALTGTSTAVFVPAAGLGVAGGIVSALLFKACPFAVWPSPR